MADHDDLKNPQPHAAPTKKLTDKVIELALSAGGGAVTLVSGLLAAALIMYSGYVLYDTFATERAASSSAWDLLQYKPEILEDPEASLDPSALAEINSDYRAWLTVYETTIDYPLVQGKDDYYYAYHDIYGESSLTGAIYLAAGNSPDFSDEYNLVYGHHMDNGAMFGALDKMTGSETGIVITSDTVYDVQFFAVVTTDAYEQRIYDVGDRMDDVLDFLRSGGEGGVGVGTEVVYFNEEAAADAEKLVALSTCADARTLGRLVVIGKMTPRVITKEVTVSKVWEDNNDQDGIRPDSVTVTANDGTKAVLKAEENWTVTLTLPKYDNAGEITYTWSEDTVPAGYTLTWNVTEGDATTLTNTHAPAVRDLTVTKEWADDGDRDGIRPGTVTAVLSDGTEVTLSEDNGWTATVTDKPVYADGQKIEYTWTEKEVPGYSCSAAYDGDQATLTNTHQPETMTLGVEKEWDDNNNQDGIRPGSLDVTLYGNGREAGTVTLNEENGWTGSIENLFVNQDGQPISYEWKEAETEGYTLDDSWTEGNVTILLNLHIPETVDLTVSKVWDDDGNRDGIRPGRLRVTLSNGQHVTLDNGNSWTATLTGLPKYRNGEEIAYTWTEAEIRDYEQTGYVTRGYSTVITNRHETDTTVATVAKVWEDDNDRDGLRPGQVTLTLYAGDQPAAGIDPVILSEGNNWTATVSGLPLNDNGQPVKYSWAESEIEGYTAGYSADGTVTTVTNTHIPDKADLTVTKAWNDNDDQDGIRPDSVRATLLAGGEFVTGVTLSKDGGWTATVKDLPVNAGGKAIAYTWTEEVPEGYEAKVTAGETAGTTVITNTHTPETASLTVKKAWKDDNNRDGVRPGSVKATLYADGEEAAQLILTEDNNWTASTEPLPVYADGKAIEYTWEEDAGPYYDLTDITSADGVTTLTNTHTPETVIVSVQKVWDDDGDRDRARPTSVTVRLYADGAELTSVPLNQANNWRASFEGLYKYAAGVPITYTWSEDPVTGYECVSSPDPAGDPYHTVLTNTHEIQKVTLSVEKVWDDDDDRDAKRPDTLAVTLYADGKEARTAELNAENSWKTEVEVPVNDKGKAITYTWKEENVPGYTVSTATEGNASVLTNTHKPAVTKAIVKKVWDDDSDRDGLRPESLTVHLIADGQPLRDFTLNETNGWTLTVEDLLVYDQGRAIKYTWSEDVPEGYKSRKSENGFTTTFTNTHETAKQTLSVTKVWDDGNDQDGVRPASLTVTLLADSKAVGSVTLDAGNGWTGSIADLPVNAGGKAIAYAWDEGTVESYTLSGNVTSGTATVLTNTHETERTVATVTKVWDDDNNRDGIRPKSVVMTLSDGTEVTLDKDNNWTATVENLPKYKDGQEIAYSWTEGAIEGYEQTGNETVGTVTTVTNTHSSITMSLTVKKVWTDDDDRDGLRPENLFATLKIGEQPVATVELNEENGWTATVDDLLMYGSEGHKYIYTWTEPAIPGYTPLYPVTEGSVTTLENVHVSEGKPLTVQKVWDDNNNQDGKRPKEVTVVLKADGTEIGRYKLNDANKWTVTTEPLPVSAEGKDIAYTWSEENVTAGYTLSVDPDPDTGITILTNTHKPETVRLTVKKEWKDSGSSKRPSSISVYLIGSTVTGQSHHALDTESTKYSLTAKDNWTLTVTVPRYRDGREISYKWQEVTVSGYRTTTTTKGSVTTITNTKTSGGGGGGGTPKTYTLTIKYVYEDGTVAAKTYTATYQKGKTYSVTSPVLDGYTASEKVVKGTMPGNDLTVTVTYTRSSVPTPDPDTPLGVGPVYFNVGDCLE